MRTLVFSRLHFPSLSRSPAACNLGVAAATLAFAALAGCTTVESVPGMRPVVTFLEPYKADIVQGNVVTTEQMAKIKVGMSRVQVKEALGSPLLADPFHAARWDYVFTMRRQGIAPIQRAFFVTFDNDAVAKIEAPTLPSEAEFVASISRSALPTSTPKLELTEAEKAKLPVPAPVVRTTATAASAVAGEPTRTFPPLEAR